jgi:hypothetical protein
VRGRGNQTKQSKPRSDELINDLKFVHFCALRFDFESKRSVDEFALDDFQMWPLPWKSKNHPVEVLWMSFWLANAARITKESLMNYLKGSSLVETEVVLSEDSDGIDNSGSEAARRQRHEWASHSEEEVSRCEDANNNDRSGRYDGEKGESDSAHLVMVTGRSAKVWISTVFELTLGRHLFRRVRERCLLLVRGWSEKKRASTEKMLRMTIEAKAAKKAPKLSILIACVDDKAQLDQTLLVGLKRQKSKQRKQWKQIDKKHTKHGGRSAEWIVKTGWFIRIRGLVWRPNSKRNDEGWGDGRGRLKNGGCLTEMKQNKASSGAISVTESEDAGRRENGRGARYSAANRANRSIWDVPKVSSKVFV